MTRGQCRGHYTEHVKSVRFVTLRRTWEGDDIMLIWFISNLDESVRPPLGSFRPCRDWPGLAWEGVLTSSRPALPYKLSCLQSVFLQPGSVLLSGHGRLWSRQYDSSGLLPFHLFSYNGPPINFTTCLVNIPLWRLPWAEIAQEVVKYHRWMAFYEYNCWICLNQVAPVTKKKKKKSLGWQRAVFVSCSVISWLTEKAMKSVLDPPWQKWRPSSGDRWESIAEQFTDTLEWYGPNPVCPP